MSKRLLILLACALGCCGGLRAVRAQDEIPHEPQRQARELFLEIARISNLPLDRQKHAMSHLYRDIVPKVYIRSYSIAPSTWLGEMEARLKSESPQAVAAEIERKGGWADEQEAARDLCLKLLAARLPDLQPLLLESLQSKQASDRTLALDLIRDACGWEVWGHPELMRLPAEESLPKQREVLLHSPLQVYVDPVLRLYLTDRDLYVSSRTRYTLPALQNPRILDTLLNALDRGESLPDLPEVLQQLCRQRPPPPKLLRDLESPVVERRRTAAMALTLSGSHLLVPYVKALTQDRDPDIRISASLMGTNLPQADWEQVRPSVLPLLKDSVGTVRGRVAGILAAKEGKQIAPALLRLIQDESLPMEAHFYVYDAICRVAGQDFGYINGYYRDQSWRPETSENRAAIRKFAAWVEAYASPAPHSGD